MTSTYIPHTNNAATVAMDHGVMDDRLHEIAIMIGDDRPDYAYVLEEAARRLRVLGDLFTILEGQVRGVRELITAVIGDDYT